MKKSVGEDGSTVHFMRRLRGEGTHEKKLTQPVEGTEGATKSEICKLFQRVSDQKKLFSERRQRCASAATAHLADEGTHQHVGGGFLNRLISTRAFWRRSKTVEQLYNTAGCSRSKACMSSTWFSDDDRFQLWPFCSSGDTQGYTLETGKSLMHLKQLRDEMRLSHVNIRMVEEHWKRHRAAVTSVEKNELGNSAEIEMSGPV